MPSDDHRSQREGLVEDMESSGGEEATGTPSDDKTAKAAKQEQKTLKDSMLPVLLIFALLLTFGAVAGVSIYVVTQAFQDDPEHPNAPTAGDVAAAEVSSAIIKATNSSLFG